MEKTENKEKSSNSLETTNFRFQIPKKNLFFTYNPLEINFLQKKRFEERYQISKTNEETNYGYWTKSEHNKFIEALYLYNCDWLKTQSYLKNRTYYQISSHAQKFFLKLKTFKDEKLGLDFTSDNINKLKDIIKLIKQKEQNESILDNNINKKLLFIISEKLSFGKALRQKEEEKTLETKEENKINNLDYNNINLNINNINYYNNGINVPKDFPLNDDLTINNIKNCDFFYSFNDSEENYENILIVK